MFQSPLGFLLFQTNNAVLNRFGRLFQSPLGFLLFQTQLVVSCAGSGKVSIPFGVSALPNYGWWMQIQSWRSVSIPFGVSVLPNCNRYGITDSTMFQSPLGFLFFQTSVGSASNQSNEFQSPLGFLFFQTTTQCVYIVWG